MAYAQNTITSANAADDFVGVLNGLLIEAGWVEVETLTPSVSTNRNRIYRSPGTTNLCGYDWFLAVSWSTLGTENFVRVIAAEQYNETTNILSGICGATFSETPTSGGGSGAGSGYRSALNTSGHLVSTTLNLGTLNTNTSPLTIVCVSGASSSSTSQSVPGFQTLIPSSAFGYWMSVTLDHVALWTTVATNRQSAVMSSLVLDADFEAEAIFNHTPLVGWGEGNVPGGSYLQGSSHFLVSAAPTNTVYTAAAITFSGVYGAKLPALSDTYLDAYAWQPYIYLSYMGQGPVNPTPGTQIAGQIVVGRAPDFLMVWGGSVGDTVEVDSAVYVLTGPMLSSWSTDLRPTIAVLVEV